MSNPTNLTDIYIEELQDLWSANDQMKDVVREMAEAASDDELSGRLRRSTEGIQLHTNLLKELIENAGGQTRKEHCKGMAGLVAEARKHATNLEAKGPVRDVAIISQYQRMCHYGIAGFGTAKAYAEALNRNKDVHKLDEALEHIYESDDYLSELATRSKNLDAAAA
jgi:ferritin-like metal-binding protein YciE